MFKRRFLLTALLLAATCLPLPPSAMAVSEDQTAQTAAANRKGKSKTASKATPTPTPKPKPKSDTAKSSSSSSASSASSKSGNAKSKAPASKSSASGTSSKSGGSSSQTAKKKKKSKPKPATKKRPSSQAAPAGEPKPQEPQTEKKTEPTKKPEPEPEPEKKTEPEPVKKSDPPSASAPKSSLSPKPKPASRGVISPGGSVVVQKSGIVEEEPAPTPEPEETAHWWWPFGGAKRYKYLTPAVRTAIDNARVERHRWRYIVVHNSGTRQGNAKAFDYYHRNVRKMPNGLAYHFVIGNGTSSGNGRIEIGSRWTRQINGGHVHSDYLNSIALGICLVGDYNRDRPTPEQLEALNELIRYLRTRVGKTDHQLAIVKPHRDINPPQWPTDCPGDRFPYEWLHSKFD